jgi:hypothetical protein
LTQDQHDAGSKVLLPVPIWIRSSAVFGGLNNEYRYTLERAWDDSLPTIMWVMMNPSVADSAFDDRTVARTRSYSEDWGFGRMLVGNTFAFRATDQKRLMTVPDPIGPDNDAHLQEMASRASLILFAYGKPHPSLQYRGPAVARLLSDGGKRPIHVLKLCADGKTPSHPLYLKGNLKPLLWRSCSTINC